MPFNEIRLTHRETSISVAPGRGAHVTSLVVDGREILYMDRATFDDPAKNVRGGIPILFPFAGRLDGDLFLALPEATDARGTGTPPRVPFTADGAGAGARPYIAGTTIPQHGFGRTRAWTVTGQSERHIVCALEPDAAAKAVYPYDFKAEQTCRIIPRGVLVELRIRNRGAVPLPVAPGWHPYFRCPSARKPEIAGSVPGLTPEKFPTDSEFDFGLSAPTAGATTFQIPDLGTLALGWSPDLHHLQFWSPAGKDFVCIEPFTGPADAVNRPDQRVEIPPGSVRLFWMRIELRP